MGFAASSARLYMLVARKSDLEFQLQMINQSRMRLSNVMMRLFLLNGNLEPDSPEVRSREPILQAVQQQDKILEVMVHRIEKQHEAVTTEIESVRKVISKNIEMSFKLMG